MMASAEHGRRAGAPDVCARRPASGNKDQHGEREHVRERACSATGPRGEALNRTDVYETLEIRYLSGDR